MPGRLVVTPTPNPNSMKITTDRKLLDKGSKTFDSPAEAKAHPLAAKLFEVAGVRSVFFLGDFVTVTKDSGADWKALLPAVESAVRDYLG